MIGKYPKVRYLIDEGSCVEFTGLLNDSEKVRCVILSERGMDGAERSREGEILEET
jgi:hypothetical protein